MTYRFRQTARRLGEARASALEPLYAEVCRAHDGITDFRGKLLALVPTLSGAAFALIIATRKDFDLRLLLPVGDFWRGCHPWPLLLRAARHALVCRVA
jgi:hypothetical protein